MERYQLVTSQIVGCINLSSFVISAANLGMLPFIIGDIRKVKPICHRNFWVSMILLHIAFICFVFSSIFVNFGAYFTNDLSSSQSFGTWIAFHANFLGCFSAGLQMGSIYLIFMERLLATYKHRNYEGSRRLGFIVVATLLVFLFGCFSSYTWYKNNFYVNTAVFYSVDIISIFLILFLLKLNQRLRRLKNSSNIVLTHRYQIFENLRMLRYVLPLIMWGSIGLVAGGTTSICLKLLSLWLFNVTPSALITGCYYYSVLNLSVFISYSHSLLRQPPKRQAIHCFLKKYLFFNPPTKVSPETLERINRRKDALGDYIVFEPKLCEGDIYFNMLQKDW